MEGMSFVSGDILGHIHMELTVSEVHTLAYHYHISLNEAWHLPCTYRGVFVDHLRLQIKLENGEPVNT